MRFWGSIEEANKAALNRAANYRTATEYMTAINKVLKDFDNKVYNCRLEKALKAATDNKVFCHKNDYSLQIYCYTSNGYSHQITLASVKTDDLPDGKRIPAKKLIESMQSYRETLLRKAFEIESEIENMPYVMEYIEQTKNKLENYCRSFNDDLRDIYNIPYCIRTN